MNATFSPSGMLRCPDGIEREVDESRMVEAPITEFPDITKRKLSLCRKAGIAWFMQIRYYLRGKQVWPPLA